MNFSLRQIFLGTALFSASSAFAASSALPAYERVVLSNGAEVLLMEKHDVPLIAIRASVRGGSLADATG